MQQAAARGIALTITGGILDRNAQLDPSRDGLTAALHLRRPGEIGYASAIADAIDARIDARIADQFAVYAAAHERADPVPAADPKTEFSAERIAAAIFAGNGFTSGNYFLALAVLQHLGVAQEHALSILSDAVNKRTGIDAAGL